MGKADLRSRTRSLVDDVVCQGVRYLFEIGVLKDGRHATALIRVAATEGAVLGGFYSSMDRMVAQLPIDLHKQGVPPSVVAYVQESFHLLTIYD